MQINITHNIETIKEELERINEKHWPKVLSYASNETAFYVRNKLRKEMPSYIDRPKPFTLNSIFVTKGSTRDAEASVQWKKPESGTSGGRYLKPLVDAGSRHLKGFEVALQAAGLMQDGYVAVPDKAMPVDQYGNVSSARIKSIIDQLMFNPFGSNYGKSRSKQLNKNIAGISSSRTAINKKVLFVVPRKIPGNNLSPGIYERIRSKSGTSVVRLFGFYPSADYKAYFPFYEIGTKASMEMLPVKISEAIDKLLNNEKVGA